MIAHKNSFIPKKYINPLNLNGMNGRFLRIPNTKKHREILMIYGHHSSLERIYGIAEDLAQYGTVTVPDLPGFGGMDSLYKIDEVADINTLADYLAAFIKLRYKKRHISIAGFSLGSAIVTRMLQQYPEIADQCELIFSVAGFSTWEDFKFTPKMHLFYRFITRFFDGPMRAWFLQNVIFCTPILLAFYRYMPNARQKFAGLSREEFHKMIRFDVELWRNNEMRTYLKTANEMMKLDLTNAKIDRSIRHISLGETDQYFKNDLVELHFNQIYRKCTIDHAVMNSHMPSVIASKDETKDLIPKASRRILNRRP